MSSSRSADGISFSKYSPEIKSITSLSLPFSLFSFVFSITKRVSLFISHVPSLVSTSYSCKTGTTDACNSAAVLDSSALTSVGIFISGNKSVSTRKIFPIIFLFICSPSYYLYLKSELKIIKILYSYYSPPPKYF